MGASMGAGELFVACTGDTLVACGVVNREFARGYENVPWPADVPWEAARCLHLFCVHPDHRGGTGKAFLRGLMELCREEGVGVVRLDTFEHNGAARHLYEVCGFVYAGVGHMEYDDQEVSRIPFAMYELVL